MTARQYANYFAQTDHSCNYLTPWSKNIYAFEINQLKQLGMHSQVEVKLATFTEKLLTADQNSMFNRKDELLETCRDFVDFV